MHNTVCYIKAAITTTILCKSRRHHSFICRDRNIIKGLPYMSCTPAIRLQKLFVMHVSSVTIGFISESGRLIEILVKVTGRLSPYFPVLYFYCIKFHFAVRNPSYFTLKHVECDGRGNGLQTCIWYHQHPLPYDADVEDWHRLALIYRTTV